MQTGAGKTYTMSGESQQYSRRGITPRALHHIFEQMDIRVDRQTTVKISFVEVYNEVRNWLYFGHLKFLLGFYSSILCKLSPDTAPGYCPRSPALCLPKGIVFSFISSPDMSNLMPGQTVCIIDYALCVLWDPLQISMDQF